MFGSFARFARRSVRSSLLRALGSSSRGPMRVMDFWLDMQTQNPSAETVLHAYLHGRFPLTEPETGCIFWKSPDSRGVVPMDGLRVPKNIKRLLRQGRFQVSINHSFDEVVRACSERHETWITDQIIDLYGDLHRMGLAHSFEAWSDGELVGGSFGVSLGSYFVGVSQFNRVSDAGKVAFIHCHETLQQNSFLMHDVQESTSHLEQFGCIEMPSTEFRTGLLRAIAAPCGFDWKAHTDLTSTAAETTDASPVSRSEESKPDKAESRELAEATC
jgi:leucyl/phenylalanyl-tRNA--protein transferase